MPPSFDRTFTKRQTAFGFVVAGLRLWWAGEIMCPIHNCSSRSDENTTTKLRHSQLEAWQRDRGGLCQVAMHADGWMKDIVWEGCYSRFLVNHKYVIDIAQMKQCRTNMLFQRSSLKPEHALLSERPRLCELQQTTANIITDVVQIRRYRICSALRINRKPSTTQNWSGMIIWSYMIMYDHIWSYVNTYDHVWSNVCAPSNTKLRVSYNLTQL